MPHLDVAQIAGFPFVQNIDRGDIFWVDVPQAHTVGSEQYSASPRPWVIMSANSLHRRLPIVLAVPLSHQVQKAGKFRGARILIPAAVRLPGHPDSRPLTGDSLALTEQTRVLSHGRLVDGPAAKLPANAIAAVEAGLKDVFDMP